MDFKTLSLPKNFAVDKCLGRAPSLRPFASDSRLGVRRWFGQAPPSYEGLSIAGAQVACSLPPRAKVAYQGRSSVARVGNVCNFSHDKGAFLE